ncbi:LOW QUALITY PROTEIN: mitogen-activated protein kinase kinase kinase 12-like [Trichoplusia ni]|uniref:LOW QUALITY PROTEIN: mitogen-activated protein kinase kinase kinase 12-like n=1 Tax=Trichoplusia ni TaxID=7111 RepID=A0A7E5W6I1_TRINI|nr:LOW QUALITY PROTEIN: mitogen-activated protein kinase kinase kinase 12-like [Trichoplusia ni]
MEGNPPGDPETKARDVRLQGCFPSLGDEDDKKKLLWMGGVMNCFSNVLSFFSQTDLKAQDEEWDVPYEKLSNLVYLGAGAQGIVFGGSTRGELVAVKKLRDRNDCNIKHLRKLNHENIVQFKGISTNGPSYCIIMEFCQYGPLFEYLHSGACFRPAQILNWAKEIAQGMSYLHSHKIIHRDLKSPNILVADNLVVKVSDFGTSKEWNDVSAIMSFTGTVAWMAPEVIRHEPCSERVDVWSYGVVLWELLTQEVPYKNLETHAIMWGVGTDTISLPIPSTCPSSMQLLMNQCWNRTPRNRPPFKIIAASLEIAGEELASFPTACFNSTQAEWRQEVQENMLKLYARSESEKQESGSVSSPARREDLRSARDVRVVYERQLSRANELYLEVCSVRLQLEQREKDLQQRELALKACRCGIRRNLKYHHQPTTETSSDMPMLPLMDSRRRFFKKDKEKKEPSQVIVSFNEKGACKTVSVAVPESAVSKVMKDVTCMCKTSAAQSAENNNLPVKMKDTVVEQNGNIDIKPKGRRFDNYRNNIPDIAHV